MTTVGAVERRTSTVVQLRRARWYHPESTAALLAVAAWPVLIELHRHRAANPLPGGAAPSTAAATAGWLAAQGSWLVMASAMMLPSALPMTRWVALNSKWRRRQRAGAEFVGGYLAVWALFGLVAVSAARCAGVLADAGWLLPTALLVAAAWELTPAKRRRLRECHRTVPLAPDAWKADIACLGAGLRHGRACVGACWALMAPTAIAGHADLALMITLTLLVGAEKVLVKGTSLTRVAALVLATWAAVTAVSGASALG